jgi:exonuclease SbcC
MVVEKIKLENFKTHKDTTVEFDKITSIIGQNGHGKTNIIKGLFLVLYNEDWPEDYIKHGETKSSITVWLSNGNRIERTRTKSSQKINIYYKDGSQKNFTGKNDAQSYVELASGISKIKLKNGDVIDLNYQEVRNKTSLLEGSAGSLAKRFSYLLKTEKVEVIKTDTSKLAKETQALLNTNTENTNKLITEISLLETKIENAEKINNSLETTNSELKKIQEDLKFLNSCKDYFTHIDYTFYDDKELLELLKKLTLLGQNYSILFTDLKLPNINLDDYWLLDVDDGIFDTEKCPTCGKDL